MVEEIYVSLQVKRSVLISKTLIGVVSRVAELLKTLDLRKLETGIYELLHELQNDLRFRI